MEIKTLKIIHLPYINIYINKGTILKVIDDISNNYTCEYKGYLVVINKNDCEEVKK